MSLDKDALDRHITGNYGEDQFNNNPYPVETKVNKREHEDELYEWAGKNEANMEITLSLDDINELLRGNNILAGDDFTGVIISLKEEGRDAPNT